MEDSLFVLFVPLRSPKTWCPLPHTVDIIGKLTMSNGGTKVVSKMLKATTLGGVIEY
jgi:hypothetical protein